MTAAMPLDQLTPDEQPAPRVRVDDVDTDELCFWLRAEYGVNFSPPSVQQAYLRLTSILDDPRMAVAYLEHLAAKNRHLFRWLASGKPNEEIRHEVGLTLGVRWTVNWPALRNAGREPLTFEEIIAAAVTCERKWELITVANQAHDHGWYRPGIYVADNVCRDIFTMQDLLLNHLVTRNKPHPADHELDEANVAVGVHRAADFHLATPAELEAWKARRP